MGEAAAGVSQIRKGVMYMVRFEIYKDRAGEFRWRFVAANNREVCWSEGYSTKQGAIDSVYWVKSWASSAPVHDLA